MNIKFKNELLMSLSVFALSTFNICATKIDHRGGSALREDLIERSSNMSRVTGVINTPASRKQENNSDTKSATTATYEDRQRDFIKAMNQALLAEGIRRSIITYNQEQLDRAIIQSVKALSMETASKEKEERDLAQAIRNSIASHNQEQLDRGIIQSVKDLSVKTEADEKKQRDFTRALDQVLLDEALNNSTLTKAKIVKSAPIGVEIQAVTLEKADVVSAAPIAPVEQVVTLEKADVVNAAPIASVQQAVTLEKADVVSAAPIGPIEQAVTLEKAEIVKSAPIGVEVQAVMLTKVDDPVKTTNKNLEILKNTRQKVKENIKNRQQEKKAKQEPVTSYRTDLIEKGETENNSSSDPKIEQVEKNQKRKERQQKRRADQKLVVLNETDLVEVTDDESQTEHNLLSKENSEKKTSERKIAREVPIVSDFVEITDDETEQDLVQVSEVQKIVSEALKQQPVNSEQERENRKDRRMKARLKREATREKAERSTKQDSTQRSETKNTASKDAEKSSKELRQERKARLALNLKKRRAKAVPELCVEQNLQQNLKNAENVPQKDQQGQSSDEDLKKIETVQNVQEEQKQNFPSPSRKERMKQRGEEAQNKTTENKTNLSSKKPEQKKKPIGKKSAQMTFEQAKEQSHDWIEGKNWKRTPKKGKSKYSKDSKTLKEGDELDFDQLMKEATSPTGKKVDTVYTSTQNDFLSEIENESGEESDSDMDEELVTLEKELSELNEDLGNWSKEFNKLTKDQKSSI